MSNPNFIPSMSTNEIFVDLDTSKCLTDELEAMKQALENIPEEDTNEYAPADHNHDGVYAPVAHSHDYAASNHNHNEAYAPASHSHDYAPSSHNHDEAYATAGHDHDEAYATAGHNHDTAYAQASHGHAEYASNSHNHDEAYAASNHTHADKADLVNGKIPISQIPDEVKEIRFVADIAARNAMTGLFAGLSVYVTDATADSTVASGGAFYLYNGTAWIKTAESESMDLVLQWANIQGRPESMPANGGNADTVDGKHASDFAAAGHNHDSAYAKASHSHTGYAASNHSHSGYAASNHTHSGYAASNHEHEEYAASNHGHDAYFEKSGGTITGETNFSGGLIRTKGSQTIFNNGSRITYGSGNLETYVTGTKLYCNQAFTVASDRRVKRDVETLDKARLVEFLKKVEFVAYNYIFDEADEPRRIGVIAQQLLEIDKEMARYFVKETEEGVYTVDYTALALLAAIAVQ